MKLARFALIPLFCLSMLLSPAPLAQAERPSAMKLFPYETLAFVRVAHGRELFESFQKTASGRFLNDPELKPFLDDLWQTAGDQFDEQASEEVGLNWEDWSKIPKGEIALGLVGRSESNPGVLLLADFDGEQADADYFLEKLRERWEADGMVTEEQQIEGETLTIVRRGDNRDTSFGYLLKETCLIASNDETLLRQLLDRWAGRPVFVEPPEDEETEDEETEDEDSEEESTSDEPLPGERTLAENSKFVTILRECSTQLEEPPQIVMYADPLGLIEAYFGNDTGARIAMATFPALGIDGILGVGGTTTFATEKWDALSHLHILLGNPRSGVLTLLRFEKGDVTPPDYVPADAFSYATVYLDAPGIFDRLNLLVDKFRYEGSLRESIDSEISEKIGIDFEEALINNLAGRVTLITSFDDHPKIQEQRAVVFTLVDAEKMAAALDTVAEKFSSRFEKQEFGGVDYYAFIPRFLRDIPDEDRPFTPCFCVLDDNLILSSSTALFEAMVEAKQETRPRLADAIEFKVVQSRVERLTRGQQLALFYYQNFSKIIGHWYDVSQQSNVRDGLAAAGENSSTAQAFSELLDRNELPPFESLEKYFPPTGGYLIDTSTGLHFMSFDLHRPDAE